MVASYAAVWAKTFAANSRRNPGAPGDPGHRVDRDDRKSGLAQRLGRAAGRDDLPAERHQLAGELHDAALVRDRQQRSHQSSATAWIMSARLTTSRKSTTSAGECE